MTIHEYDPFMEEYYSRDGVLLFCLDHIHFMSHAYYSYKLQEQPEYWVIHGLSGYFRANWRDMYLFERDFEVDLDLVAEQVSLLVWQLERRQFFQHCLKSGIHSDGHSYFIKLLWFRLKELSEWLEPNGLIHKQFASLKHSIELKRQQRDKEQSFF